MTRSEVYEVIDSERDYQDEMTMSSERPDMISNFHLGDALSAIQYNLDKARADWYKGFTPYPLAMDYIRKIAGLCVKQMEQYGAARR